MTPESEQLKKLAEFEHQVRTLVDRHEELASSEDEHYWNLLDELHHLLLLVKVIHEY